LLLEYDDSRSGSFEPLRHVPEDKFIVLGLITTKRPELESMDFLRQRVIAASRYVSLERLGLSTQCGFASSIIGNRISFDDQRRKLELVVKTARGVWG
jgi:methionine synthase II (cobalamin-independent)